MLLILTVAILTAVQLLMKLSRHCIPLTTISSHHTLNLVISTCSYQLNVTRSVSAQTLLDPVYCVGRVC